MKNKPSINVSRKKNLSITVMYVFKASFNDTLMLENVCIPLDTLASDELTWIDPFNGRSNLNNTLFALTYCSDEKFVLLEKNEDSLKEYEIHSPYQHIISEDHNDSVLLASHINLC